jgi:hypothetical protein
LIAPWGPAWGFYEDKELSAFWDRIPWGCALATAATNPNVSGIRCPHSIMAETDFAWTIENNPSTSHGGGGEVHEVPILQKFLIANFEAF